MKTTLRVALACFPLVAGIAAPHAVDAAVIKRSMLIQACTSKKPELLNNCAGYVAGVADTVDSVKDRVCIPEGLSVGLLRTGVTTYLQSHTTSDGPAAPAVLDALRSLYRCVG